MRKGRGSSPRKLWKTDFRLGRASEAAACTALERRSWRVAGPHAGEQEEAARQRQAGQGAGAGPRASRAHGLGPDGSLFGRVLRSAQRLRAQVDQLGALSNPDPEALEGGQSEVSQWWGLSQMGAVSRKTSVQCYMRGPSWHNRGTRTALGAGGFCLQPGSKASEVWLLEGAGFLLGCITGSVAFLAGARMLPHAVIPEPER